MIDRTQFDRDYHIAWECFNNKFCSDREFRKVIEKCYKLCSNAKKSATFLDVGCFSGWCHIIYDRFFDKITLADIEDYRATMVLKRFPFYKINLNSPEELPKEIGQYDFVNCLETIEHIPNDRQAMRNLYKLVKPGGFLLISTPNKLRAAERIKNIFGFPTKFPTASENKHWRVHYREYSKKDIVILIQEFNFQIKDVKMVIKTLGHYHFPFPFFRVVPYGWEKSIIILAKK